MSSPKVVVIGAGSYFFGRPVVWNMATSKVLKEGTLAFVDTNPDVLDTMMKLARRVFDETGVPTKLEGSTDRREVLKDADFVVLTFSDKNAYYRGLDCEVSLRYGVRMCSGDTIGPGGVFRALREIPTALAIAKDVQELAPDAWVINLVNPSTVLGITLMRYANVKSFALCDGLHEPHNSLKFLKAVGLLPDTATEVPREMLHKLDLRIAGVNHFTWMTGFTYEGQDMTPAFRKTLTARAEEEIKGAAAATGGSDNNAQSKARLNSAYALELWNIFGAYPDRIAHTKEYVPYFQGRGTLPDVPEPIQIFDGENRSALTAERWGVTREFAEGKRPVQEFLDEGRGDHATDIIESMWGGLGKSFYVNTANRGAVTNMADDAFLELRSHLDMHGPVPQPFGELPRGILGLTQQVLDTHELTAEAGVTCDRDVLLRAMVTDPIINSISDARKLMDELLEKERPNLDPRWYR